MKKLSKLHDTIKNHPYRMEFESQYLPSYRKLLYKFSEQFFECIKNSQQGRIAKNLPYNFEHDFNSAIFSFPNEWAIIHVELCISCIHRFIDTNRLEEYYTYYNGCNKFKSFSRKRKFVWEKNHWAPIYTKEELIGAIEEVEEYKNKKGKFNDWGIFTEDTYKYLKEKLANQTK